MGKGWAALGLRILPMMLNLDFDDHPRLHHFKQEALHWDVLR